jgi:quinol-cytochrome oxidoreductase complex cytochrome b subunit
MALPQFSVPRAAVSSIGVVMGMAIWLTLGLRFDLEISPGWQFVPYFTMMTCMLLACSLLGMMPAFRWLGRPWLILPSLPLLFLGALLTWSWVHNGPYTSIRDNRILPVVMSVFAASVIGFAILGLTQASLTLALLAGHRMGWRWVSRFQGEHSLLPCDLSSDADELQENAVGKERPGSQK